MINRKTALTTLWTMVLLGMIFISCQVDEPPPKVPANPTKIKGTPLSSTQIRVTWHDNSDNEQGFQIQRGRLDSLYYTPIASVPPNDTSYIDTGLIPLTNYAYRVFAFNSGGQSRPSPVTVIMTMRSPAPPYAPYDLRAIPTSTSRIYLAWQDNASNETGFKIERAISGTNSFFGADTVPANVTSFEDKNLLNGTAYDYRVRAYNVTGNSDYSNLATATPGANVFPPVAPSGLTASPISATQIALAWVDNSINEIGYKVERAPSGTTQDSVIATLAAGTTAYRDKNLPPSTPYTYRVYAYNTNGNSSYSNSADASTFLQSSSVPADPTDMKAVIQSPTQVRLGWDDAATNEDGYYVEQAPGGTTNFNVIATTVANESTYQVLGLNPGTSYSFRVRAYNQVGYSNYTIALTRSTPALTGKPAAPTNLKVTASSNSCILSWTDNSGNEDGYYVEREQGGTSNFSRIATLPVNSTYYTDYQVQQSTGYYYRVQAYNTAGSSSYSSQQLGSVPGRTETRFMNGSSHPIVSLIVEGTQYLAATQEIPPSSYFAVQLTQGRFDFSMKNGYWNGNQPVVFYSDTGQFIQQTGVSGLVSFTDPTIFQILTTFKYSGYWVATYDTGAHTNAFRFFADGTYFYYVDGNLTGPSQLYNLVQYNTDFTAIFSAGQYQGTLTERPTGQSFTMPNGPTGEHILTYYYISP